MIIADPGAGKTTALVELARLLAKVGVVPVVVEVWSERDIDVESIAFARLKAHAGGLVASSGQMEALWHWLRERRRLVVLIDDIDRIAPDGEHGFVMRRTLDDAAGKDLPTIATARPSGLPAGLAATAINLDKLDEAEAVEHVLRVARDEIGAVKRPTHAAEVRGNVEQWVHDGGFAEVPFYLELLAALVAVGKCPDLPPARAVHKLDEDDKRIRDRGRGRYEWSPLWVRFQLLEHF